MKKYIKLIKKAILKQIDKNSTIETLDVQFEIDGANNPVVKVKLKTTPKQENSWNGDDYEEDGACC